MHFVEQQPYNGPGTDASFLPESTLTEGSGPGYFYPFGQSHLAITGISKVSSTPG